MGEKTVIGAGTFVRGHVRGEGDLELYGRVEGDIEVDGDVTLGEGSLVKGSVSGRRLVVQGAVAGDLTAAASIALEQGARVVGDLRAPSIGVGEGALVRGRVETADAAGQRPVAKHVAVGARQAPAPARTPPREAPRSVVRPSAPLAPPKLTQRAEPAPTTTRASAVLAKPAAPPPPPPPAAKRGPPPPVVPVLKKGAKATLKKRAAT